MFINFHCIFTGKRKHTRSMTSTSSNSTISTRRMELILEKLKCQRNRSSTNKNYYSIWNKFNRFVLCLDSKPKTWEQRVSLYGAFLVEGGIQSSTLKSYISAIKCILLIDGYKWDDDKMLIHTLTLTRACRLSNDKIRTRLPIQIGLLETLLFELERIFANNWYCKIMYKALFLLGYYGLSELVN